MASDGCDLNHIPVLSAASLAELSWVEERRPQSTGVVPLVWSRAPAIAFTYAEESLARRLAAAPVVELSLTETRSTGRAFRPLVIRGRPRLVEDVTGEVFTAELLDQELRRYPPSRVYADSPLLRREHWWYLPRLIVELEVTGVRSTLGRRSARDHLLVVASADGPAVRVVPGAPDGQRVLELDVDDPPAAGAALLFAQDASFPDLERWSRWSYRGGWDGRRFSIQEVPARAGLGRAPGLLHRWRSQRELERRCVAAIPRS